MKIIQTDGTQYSPFSDETNSGDNLEITNLDNGVTVEIAELLPLMIERYGFYEGHRTPYRVDPQTIINLLELKSGKALTGEVTGLD